MITKEKVAEQLAEYEPTDITIRPVTGLIWFKAHGRLNMWAKLTPKGTAVKKHSARVTSTD